MARHFRELVVWQRAMRLVEAVYCLTRTLPPDERFGLTSQLRRSAVSVPSNIAEGHERRSRRDYRRFILVARGSLAELETQIELAVRVGLTSESAVVDATSLAEEVGRLLNAIEQALGRDEDSSSRIREGEADYP
ncbi:MAG TPA: four helix bundle protein [Xanthomonadaceae bacterium]|nr:four helix bundle protein [Xanthomonadaceae bacterium]